MSGAIHPPPQYAFMAWCSVKPQGQLYLYLYLGSGKFRIEFVRVFTAESLQIYEQLEQKFL
jgi:hypothetical protein